MNMLNLNIEKATIEQVGQLFALLFFGFVGAVCVIRPEYFKIWEIAGEGMKPAFSHVDGLILMIFAPFWLVFSKIVDRIFKK